MVFKNFDTEERMNTNLLREYGRISNSSRTFRVAPEFKSTNSVAESNPAQEDMMKQQEFS